MNKQSLFIAGAFLAGGLTGYAVAFKRVEQRLMAEFDEAVEITIGRERAAMRKANTARQEYATPQEAAVALVIPEEIEEVIEVYQGGKKDPIAYHKIKPSSIEVERTEQPAPPEPVQEENIFDNPMDPPMVYVISKVEYEHGQTENDKQTITYFAEDQVLVDEANDPFENSADVVGDGLLNFGHQSEDENIVYVRNNRVEIDYEVIRDPGGYWAGMGLEKAPPRPSQNGG